MSCGSRPPSGVPPWSVTIRTGRPQVVRISSLKGASQRCSGARPYRTPSREPAAAPAQAFGDGDRRRARQQHPLRPEGIGERQVGQPHLHHVGTAEADAVLLQDQHPQHGICDVVVAGDEADPTAHRFLPTPVAVTERVEQRLAQVIPDRPLAGRVEE